MSNRRITEKISHLKTEVTVLFRSKLSEKKSPDRTLLLFSIRLFYIKVTTNDEAKLRIDVNYFLLTIFKVKGFLLPGASPM